MSPAEKVAASKPPKPKSKGSPRGAIPTWVSRLRETRSALGLTMAEAAAGVELSIGGLCFLEYGADPHLTTALRIAEFYGKSIKELWPELAATTPNTGA